jgi:hypothetical protein
MPRVRLEIDSPVLKELKALRKIQRRSLGQIVSQLLAEALAGRKRRKEPISFKWTSRPMSAMVDLEGKEALYAALDKGRKEGFRANRQSARKRTADDSRLH